MAAEISCVTITIDTADARTKYSRVSLKKMIRMITFSCTYPLDNNYSQLFVCFIVHIGGKDESVSALESNPAIGNELLRKIKKWYSEGATTDDVIERLRLR